MFIGAITLVQIVEQKLVYAGRAGGSDHRQKGGGANPQCLPLDPNSIKQSVEHRNGDSCMEQNVNRQMD